MPRFPQIYFIENIVENLKIIIGDYTFYDGIEDSKNLERNILYYYSFSVTVHFSSEKAVNGTVFLKM